MFLYGYIEKAIALADVARQDIEIDAVCIGPREAVLALEDVSRAGETGFHQQRGVDAGLCCIGGVYAFDGRARVVELQ